MSRIKKFKYLLPTVAILSACAGPSAVTDAVKQLETPKHWVNTPLSEQDSKYTAVRYGGA